MRRPEILSPAGNLEKLRYAIDYGADAVYCAFDRFGMRTAADNFTPAQLKRGVEYAHSRGKKVYITLNTMPKDSELKLLPKYLKSASEINPDAYIVSDPGVIEVLREHTKDPVIHLSTQANTINARSCNFWYNNGVKRIVLARELSLKDIKYIRNNTPEDLELECFVHGAMCVAFSGRCLLSNYYTGRNANNGECTQTCRWRFHVREERRPDDLLLAEEYSEGTYLFSSKDMCMIEHIPELVESGITSFKIEGRVKSAYYTAVVTNAYKMALTDYIKDKKGYKNNPDYKRELTSVSHREFDTGYFFSDPSKDAKIINENTYFKEKAFLCTVDKYYPRLGLALCTQRNKLSVGDKANILSPGTTGRDITIDRLYDKDKNPIDSAPHPGMKFYLAIDTASPGDIIRGG